MFTNIDNFDLRSWESLNSHGDMHDKDAMAAGLLIEKFMDLSTKINDDSSSRNNTTKTSNCNVAHDEPEATARDRSSSNSGGNSDGNTAYKHKDSVHTDLEVSLKESLHGNKYGLPRSRICTPHFYQCTIKLSTMLKPHLKCESKIQFFIEVFSIEAYLDSRLLFQRAFKIAPGSLGCCDLLIIKVLLDCPVQGKRHFRKLCLAFIYNFLTWKYHWQLCRHVMSTIQPTFSSTSKISYKSFEFAPIGFSCKRMRPGLAWKATLLFCEGACWGGRTQGRVAAYYEALITSLRRQVGSDSSVMKIQNFCGNIRVHKKIEEDSESPAWAPGECPGHTWRRVRNISGMKAFIGQGNYWGKRCNPSKFFQKIKLKTQFHVGWKVQKFSRSADITLACNFLQTLFCQLVGCLKGLAAEVFRVVHVSSRMSPRFAEPSQSMTLVLGIGGDTTFVGNFLKFYLGSDTTLMVNLLNVDTERCTNSSQPTENNCDYVSLTPNDRIGQGR